MVPQLTQLTKLLVKNGKIRKKLLDKNQKSKKEKKKRARFQKEENSEREGAGIESGVRW